MVKKVVVEWIDRPVSMDFNELDVPISAVPFPSVTICPQTKTLKSKLNLTYVIKHANKLSDIE